MNPIAKGLENNYLLHGFYRRPLLTDCGENLLKNRITIPELHKLILNYYATDHYRTCGMLLSNIIIRLGGFIA